MPRGERRAPSFTAPAASFTANCVTITESASDRKEQKFNVPRRDLTRK